VHHEFSNNFRDWAAEQTSFAREGAEMSLAHALENKVEAAYRRGDLLQKRHKLMAAWAAYCAQNLAKSEIVPFGPIAV